MSITLRVRFVKVTCPEAKLACATIEMPNTEINLPQVGCQILLSNLVFSDWKSARRLLRMKGNVCEIEGIQQTKQITCSCERLHEGIINEINRWIGQTHRLGLIK